MQIVNTLFDKIYDLCRKMSDQKLVLITKYMTSCFLKVSYTKQKNYFKYFRLKNDTVTPIF